MKPLLLLANTFINTFGITKPNPESAERAARFIGALLVVLVLLIVAVALVLRRSFHA